MVGSGEEGKKRIGRPPKYAPGKRPIVTFRVSQELYDRFREIAEASGRSLSEEVERRVERSFEWEHAFRDKDTMLADLKARIADIEKGNLKAAMRRLGWTPARGGKGGTVWVEPETELPEADGIHRSGFLNPEADAKDGRWQPLADPQPAHPDAALAATPIDDLEETIFKAVVRAIRASRESGPDA